VLEMMELFRNQIENSAITRSYRVGQGDSGAPRVL
jgi:hypothetical protein